MKRFGLLGKNISYSKSPQIFSYIAQFTSESLEYKPLDAVLTPALIQSLVNSEFNGCNVTIPYKKEVLTYCAYKSVEVEVIGAANTISIKDGLLYAENTDVIGIAKCLKGSDLHGKSILILGAGGAARATIFALESLGVRECVIINRSESKARGLIQEFKHKSKIKLSFQPDVTSLNSTYDGVVHARPYSDDLYEQLSLKLKPHAFVFDMVYHPKETPLQKLSSRGDFKFISGLDMLIWQALKSWDIWNQTQLVENEILFLQIKRKLEAL